METVKTTFIEFAEQALANHVAELNTRYDFRNSMDSGLVDEAFKNHSILFEKELDSHIDELITGENLEYRTSLLELKQAFLNKLDDAKSTVMTESTHKIN